MIDLEPRIYLAIGICIWLILLFAHYRHWKGVIAGAFCALCCLFSGCAGGTYMGTNPNRNACTAVAVCELANRPFSEVKTVSEALDPERDGISAASAMQYGIDRGWWSGYVAISDIESVIATVERGQKCLLATRIYEGMVEQGPTGLIKPTGKDTGKRHAYVIESVDKGFFGTRMFTLKSETHRDWMWKDDLKILLERGSKVYVPVY